MRNRKGKLAQFSGVSRLRILPVGIDVTVGDGCFPRLCDFPTDRALTSHNPMDPVKAAFRGCTEYIFWPATDYETN